MKETPRGALSRHHRDRRTAGGSRTHLLHVDLLAAHRRRRPPRRPGPSRHRAARPAPTRRPRHRQRYGSQAPPDFGATSCPRSSANPPTSRLCSTPPPPTVRRSPGRTPIASRPLRSPPKPPSSSESRSRTHRQGRGSRRARRGLRHTRTHSHRRVTTSTRCSPPRALPAAESPPQRPRRARASTRGASPTPTATTGRSPSTDDDRRRRVGADKAGEFGIQGGGRQATGHELSGTAASKPATSPASCPKDTSTSSVSSAAPGVRRRAHRQLQRRRRPARPGRLRLHRMGRRPAVVRRQRRHDRHLLLRVDTGPRRRRTPPLLKAIFVSGGH